MAKKQITEKLTTISLDVLDHVTGGRGGGPGPLQRHKQSQGVTNPWAALVPTAPAETPSPFAVRQGQAGTAGTPGAFVHNGKFRPL